MMISRQSPSPSCCRTSAQACSALATGSFHPPKVVIAGSIPSLRFVPAQSILMMMRINQSRFACMCTAASVTAHGTLNCRVGHSCGQRQQQCRGTAFVGKMRRRGSALIKPSMSDAAMRTSVQTRRLLLSSVLPSVSLLVLALAPAVRSKLLGSLSSPSLLSSSF
jgi:hypothetical protein